MKLKDLPIGALVMDPLTTYYGEPIIWKVADKNHEGYPENSVTLITDRIICLKAFDGKEPNNLARFRREHGNNRYKYSNIHQWLNSDQDNWFTKQHDTDEPPTEKNVEGINAYDTENGFLTNFSLYFKNALMETKLPTQIPNIDHRLRDGVELVISKVFLASAKEIGLSMQKYGAWKEFWIKEGSVLQLFNNNSVENKIAKPTSHAFYNSSFWGTNRGWFWFTRTSEWYEENGCSIYHIGKEGGTSFQNASTSYCGVRPLCNISDTIKVNSIPTQMADGAVYTIEWNQPPTTPSSLDFRNPIRSDKEFAINWGQSTDSDASSGEQITYVLERKLDESNWVERYRGTNLTYNDTIAQGSKKAMYRVKAVDSKGGESEWKTSEAVNIVNNSIPVISSTSSDLGLKSSPFSVNYMITDEDEGQTYTVTEYIDEVQKRSYVANLNEEQTFTVTEAEWKEVINGAHRLKVKVVDSMNGQAEKVFNFSKNEDRIEVSLATSLPADDIISVALINVDMEIPEGASFLVEACNNGFDTEPVWQDVTKQVKEKKKIFFANETKTAENWGLNVRVKVQRNGAVGDCIIRGIGGNFE